MKILPNTSMIVEPLLPSSGKLNKNEQLKQKAFQKFIGSLPGSLLDRLALRNFNFYSAYRSKILAKN